MYSLSIPKSVCYMRTLHDKDDQREGGDQQQEKQVQSHITAAPGAAEPERLAQDRYCSRGDWRGFTHC